MSELAKCRPTTHAENLRLIAARLSDKLSPAEIRELNEAAAELSRRAPAASAVPEGWKLVPVEPTERNGIALNTMHPNCYKAADAFWNYWKENGETHKHGYYESTWGAINRAIQEVGVVRHDYETPRQLSGKE